MNQIVSTSKPSASPNTDYSQSCIRIVCSMAPRLFLEELTQRFSRNTGLRIELTPMGGLDAAQKVRESDQYDVAVLSKSSLENLDASERLHQEIVDLAVSEVAVAVPRGHTRPDLSDEEAVRASVISAKSISYSTGPSGQALATLFEKWGVSEIIEKRLTCPPPGTSVGSLIVSRKVELGFQQRSELIHVEGIDVIGPLPEDIQIITTFSAGICRHAKNIATVKQLLAFLNSPEAEDAKYRQGMRPA